ncbi:MAG: competence/damage-inducible protein A [Pseudomonadota bacterium]
MGAADDREAAERATGGGSAQGRAPTAAVLVIGDEILSGAIREANAHFLAGRLAEVGIVLGEIRVVPDDHERIVAAVRALAAAVDYVFTSGGIGPTHDDITADAVAAAFGRGIDVRDDARALLMAHYGGAAINAARLRMARIPDGARLIDNPVSAAPGFALDNVFVMAGVPSIFRAMVESVLPGLQGGAAIASRALEVMRAEGDIAATLGALAAAHPAVSIGCYPFFRGRPGARVVLRAADADALAAAAADTEAALAALPPATEVRVL